MKAVLIISGYFILNFSDCTSNPMVAHILRNEVFATSDPVHNEAEPHIEKQIAFFFLNLSF